MGSAMCGCYKMTDRKNVQCPYLIGAIEPIRCTGTLHRSKILDAEKDSSQCDKCGHYFGIELIEK
jgi:hypothetical protein